MKVAIYTQKFDEENLTYLKRFIHAIQEKSVSVVVHEKVASALGLDINTFDSKEELQQYAVELFFTFGGDGTIVNSLLYIEDSQVPIVGVNTGRLGFLASFSKEEIFSELEEILNKNYVLSERSVIEVTSPNDGSFFPYALNDVTVSRRETTSMITIDSYLNDEFLNVFWGDGLIISSPTGSTAYSLSCGGPIISPNSENFVITPIAPHNLNVRPLIVNDGVEIRLKIASRASQYSLSLDSRIIHIDVDTEIVMRKATFKVVLVHPKSLSFYETIRQKLLWGKDQRN